jgi:hypothetical protein
MRAVISQEDITAAETFLAEYLTEAVPEASFQVGSAVRDLAVKAFAHIFAFLRGESGHIADMLSLQRIAQDTSIASGTESADVKQMVDEILSNWFISRNSGIYARMTAQFHFAQRATVTLRNDTKFWRSSTLAFYLDTNNSTYVVTGDAMRPVYDTRGRLVDYIVDIPLRASRAGASYNIPAGRFIKIETPAGIPYLSYVSHTDDVSSGRETETTSEFISRAQTAITVRNMVNNRSIDAVLQNEFTQILSTLTIGMGEAEMIRDRRVETGAHLELHLGGHYDTYLEMPSGSYEENGMIGGLFQRPDGIAMAFRDPQLTYDQGKTFTSLGIQPGYVLYLTEGIVGSPRGYTIHIVEEHQLMVSEATPFTQASDELTTNAVEYSIGWLSPSFNNVNFGSVPVPIFQRVATVSSSSTYAHVTAGTSRRLSSPGVLYLSGRPVLDVTNVEVTNPSAGDPLIDPTTGTIRFPNRTNLPPVIGSAVGTSEYQVQVLNPEKSQSAETVTAVTVGYYTNPIVFDGKNLRVRYMTLPTFTDIHTFARRQYDRVLAANHLIRSRHPVWISAMVPIRYKPTATNTATFEGMQTAVSDMINSFDMNDYLDMSDIMTTLRDNYTQVGTVFPFEITYDLHMPDGQVVKFATADIVSIRMTDTNGVYLTNSDEIVVPTELIDKGITSIATGTDLDAYYRLLGISDRTVTYKCRPELVTVYLRG